MSYKKISVELLFLIAAFGANFHGNDATIGHPGSPSRQYLLEKSATAFNHSKAVKRTLNFNLDDYMEWAIEEKHKNPHRSPNEFGQLMKSHRPLIVIVGPTGSQKSKLGVELAKLNHGEVISADSMQVYKGLDIATNKISAAEMQGIPHHLMSFVEPPNARYAPSDYQRDALEAINDVHRRGKMPLLVGGSPVYAEVVMFIEQSNYWSQPSDVKLQKMLRAQSREELFAELERKDEKVARRTNKGDTDRIVYELQLINDREEESLLRAKVHKDLAEKFASNASLYAELERRNGAVAKGVSINDRPKMEEALMDIVLEEREQQKKKEYIAALPEKFKTMEKLYGELEKRNKVKAKEIGKENKEKIYYELGEAFAKARQEYKKQADISNELRFKNSLVFIMEPDLKIYKHSLDARTNDVMAQGIKEFEQFYEEHKANPLGDRGLTQCIGWKQFQPYLKLSEAQKATAEGKLVMEKCTAHFKADLYDYSEKQIPALRMKIQERCQDERHGPLLVVMDASRDFKSEILPFAVDFTKYFLDSIAKKPPQSTDEHSIDAEEA